MNLDIKGGNILVDNAGVCKLTDFGSSKKIVKFSDNEGNLHQSLRGTAHWMAPEVIKQTNVGR
jgi:serine/threonine protein kinase